MRRRHVLASVIGVLAATPGCLDQLDADSSDESTSPGEITNWSAERGGVETDASENDAPEISVDWNASTVTVRGIAKYGSTACGYIDFEPPEYDPTDGDLLVEVVSERGDPPDEGHCEDDIGTSSYEVTVAFDEGIPDRIVAREPYIDVEAVEEPTPP